MRRSMVNFIRRMLAQTKAARTIALIEETEPVRYKNLLERARKQYPTPQTEDEEIFWRAFSDYSGLRLPKGYGRNGTGSYSR